MTEYHSHTSRMHRRCGVAILICLAGNALLQAGPAGSLEASSNKKDSATRLVKIDQKLANVNQVITGFETHLKTLLEVINSLEAKNALQVTQQLQAEKERLNGRVADLEKWIAEQKDLLGRIEEGNKNKDSEESLQGQVREAKAELDGLQRKVNELKTKGNPSFKPLPAGMEPMTFVLSNGRVAPYDSVFFKGSKSLHQGKLYAVIDKDRDGQLVEEAINANGCLATGMARIDPQKKYIGIIVCPDSVGAFDRIIKKVKEKGFLCVWEPASALPWFIPLDNINSGPSGTGLIGF